MHVVDTAEVRLFLFVETLLSASNRGRADHVDETIGMVVDESDALIAGLRSDEHDDTQVVAVGNGLDKAEIVVEGQIGDDHA